MSLLDRVSSFVRESEVLSGAERLRAERFRDSGHRGRWTTSRAFLRQVLSRYVDDPPEAIRFETTSLGKPVMVGHPTIHFSLSHAGEVTVVAVTTVGPVGIDVEPLRTFSDFAGMMSISLTANERAKLERRPMAERPIWFLHGWTRKEALLKASGAGLSDGLQCLEVSLDPDDARIVTWKEQAINNWLLMRFDPYEGHVGAIGVECKGNVGVQIVRRQLETCQ